MVPKDLLYGKVLDNGTLTGSLAAVVNGVSITKLLALSILKLMTTYHSTLFYVYVDQPYWRITDPT